MAVASAMGRSNAHRLAVWGLWVALAGCAARETDRAEGANVSIDLETYSLANGLEVVLVEDHRLPLVAVNVRYHVGSADEAPERTPLAHLVEHMMFQGSRHVAAGAHVQLLEAAGARNFDAETGFDFTGVYETLPADQLELALWLESDRMGYLIDGLDEANLANQKDVVRNERRQSVDSRPDGRAQEALYAGLFPPSHPYHEGILGSHADIQALTVEDVQAFIERYYVPNNATLVIVGAFDRDATRSWVEKYFGTLRGGEPVVATRVETPRIVDERRIVVRDRVELPQVYMAWLTPPAFEPGDAEAQMAALMLAGGRSSRLYQRLVREEQIAQDVSAFQWSLGRSSIFTIQATVSPEHTPEEVERAISAEVEALGQTEPSSSEVDRARNTIETHVVRDSESFGNLADRIGAYSHYAGRPDFLDEDLARFEGATPASVGRFVREHLSAGRVVAHLVPGEPESTAPVPVPALVETNKGAVSLNGDEPWRSEKPARGSVAAWTLSVPQSFELPNGLTVLVNPRPGLPIVSASIVVRVGSGANPSDYPGLAGFHAGMLDKGTATRGALEIAEEIGQLGASLTTVANADATQVLGSSLRRVFPSLLTIMADVVLHPTFSPEEVERERAGRIGTLVRQRVNAGAAAQKSLLRALYGSDHPYGHIDIGTEAALRSITRDDLLAFWSGTFVPSNAALIVSGQITVDELRPIVEQSFGAWSGAASLARPAPARESPSTRLVLIDRPGAEQTQVRVGTIGVPRAAEDYAAVLLMNQVLGGLNSSRIRRNLRGEHGYTYFVSSQFGFRRSSGPFSVSSAIRTDATAPAIAEIIHEIRRIRDESVTDEELTLAKDFEIQSVAARFETSASATTATADVYVYDLGLDYYTNVHSQLTEVSAEQVQTAAVRHLDPNRLIVVAAGDLARIRRPLEELRLGPVELRDVDGEVIR